MVSVASENLDVILRSGIEVGRVGVFGIATRYGLDGPGIVSRWGRDFPQPSRLALEPTQPFKQWLPSPFPAGKAAGAWNWPSISSSGEVKDRAELYFTSNLGINDLLRVNLTFTFYQGLGLVPYRVTTIIGSPLSRTIRLAQPWNFMGILAWEYGQCTKFQSRIKPKWVCEGQWIWQT